jgi:hypothetical protein
MKTKTLFAALVLGASFAAAAGAQVISYSPRTGDVWIDTELGYTNDYGRRDRDYFVDDVVNNFGAPRYLINDLLTTRHWSPGDVYYACALAYQAKRPCGDVARAYEDNDGKGKGWGVVAMRMGIKPGSPEFHALKGQLGKSNGRYKAHGHGGPVAGDRRDGDQGEHGNSGKGHGEQGKDHGEQGKGNGNKGKGKDKGHGH